MVDGVQRRQIKTLGPQRSQVLSEFLAQQKKPSGVTPLAGGLDVASNLVQAFTKKRQLEQEQQQEADRSSELARILGGGAAAPVGVPQEGQIPGAPTQPGGQPTLDSITAALVGSQDPSLQQLGVQQRFQQLGRQGDIGRTIAAEERGEQARIRQEQRGEQAQIRQEERKAALPTGQLEAKKLDLANRKLDQDIRKFEAELASGGVSRLDTFKESEKLRKDFVSLSKEFIKQRDGFVRVQASAQDPSAAGDLALIFNFMKIQDPGSVVRESEFKTAADAGALTDRVAQQAYDQVITGRRLAPEQREDFVNRSEILFGTADAQHQQRVGEFTRLSENFGLDPQNIIIDLGIAEQQAKESQQEPSQDGGIGGGQQLTTPSGIQFKVIE